MIQFHLLKTKRLLLCGMIVAALLAASCKKNDSGSNNNSSGNGLNAMEQKLVGKWTIESETNYNYTPGARDTIAYDELSPCEKDNTFSFASDRTYTEDDGAVLCSPTTNGAPFSWKINTADSLFTFVSGPSFAANNPKILQLDNTTLMTLYNLNGGWGSSVGVIVCVYKKKN